MRLCFLFLLLFLFVGCASKQVCLPVQSGDISTMTTLGSVTGNVELGGGSYPAKEFAISMSRHMDNPEGDFFSNQLSSVSINGYNIVYVPEQDGFLITKDKKSILSVQSNIITIYDDTVIAPALGSERITIMDNYIEYKGKESVVQDFGYDGPDVIYQKNNPDDFANFFDKKVCKKWKSLSSGIGCCLSSDDQIDAYGFSYQGWQKFKSERSKSRCQNLFDERK